MSSINQHLSPHFIIGGAPRCGTTWLCHALDRHPHVYMAKPYIPEPKFFHVDSIYNMGLDQYRQKWFSDARPDQITGEKTTYYLENHVAAERIQRDAPWAKLIFILRDPVERAFSNFLWSRMNNVETEDFETALALEEQRAGDVPERYRFVRPHAYFSRGLYALQLAPYFERFPREQILCLKCERIASEPERFISDIHAFLGIEILPETVTGLGVINLAQGEEQSTMSAELVEKLRRDYAPSVRDLTELLGEDFAWW